MRRADLRRLLFCATLLLSAGAGHAQNAIGNLRGYAADFWDELKQVVGEGDMKRLRVEYENDVFYSTDSNYTNGVRFTWRAGAREAVKFDSDDERPCLPGRDFKLWANGP